MPAAKKNLIIEKRATFRWNITWQTAKGKGIDLTGCIARLDIKATVADVSPLFSLTTEDGRITILPKGVITFLIVDGDTADLDFAAGVYDLILTMANGDRIRLLEGKVTVSPGVSA